MRKRILLIGLLALGLISGCQKNELVDDSSTQQQPILLKSTSIYFEDVGSNLITPTTDPKPSYSFSTSTPYWTYNDDYTMIEAHGSMTSHVYDAYPDSNCYAKAQVMLVEDDQIYNSYSNYSYQFTTDGGYSATTTASGSWSFPVTEYDNLEGVTIVSQGLVWGCFGNDEFDRNHAILWTSTHSQLFNLPQPLPATPSNLTIDEQSIILSWDTAVNATSYRIYRKQDSGSWGVLATTSSTSYRDYSVIKLPDSNTFYYKIQSVNNVGVSTSYSNIVYTMGTTMD